MTKCPKDGMMCTPAACCGAIEDELRLPDLNETIYRDAMLGYGAGLRLRAMCHPHGWLMSRQERRWDALQRRIEAGYGEAADALGLGGWYPRTDGGPGLTCGGIRTWELEHDLKNLLLNWERAKQVLDVIAETRKVLEEHDIEETNYAKWFITAAGTIRNVLQDLAVSGCA